MLLAFLLTDCRCYEILILFGSFHKKLCCLLFSADGSKLDFSMDHVPAFKLLFWPCEAQEWIDRDRKWPSADIVQSIVDKGCQIVPRSSPGGDIHSECRLSFSIPEAELAKLQSKDQQRSYYYFKVLFNRYVLTNQFQFQIVPFSLTFYAYYNLQ